MDVATRSRSGSRSRRADGAVLPKLLAAIASLAITTILVIGAIGVQPADASQGGIWISDAELDALPTTGATWNVLATAASATPIAGNPTLTDQDSLHGRGIRWLPPSTRPAWTRCRCEQRSATPSAGSRGPSSVPMRPQIASCSSAGTCPATSSPPT